MTRQYSGARRLTGVPLMLFLLSLTSAASPAELPTDPILRIDPGEHTAIIRRIATDDAGRWLVTASDDKTARVWDLRDGRLMTSLRVPIGSGNDGKLNAVALSPDGQTVALGGATRLGQEGTTGVITSIFLFERASGRFLRRLSGLSEHVFHLAFSPDGRTLAATLAAKQGLRLFSVADGRLIAEDRDYDASSYSVHFSPSDPARLVTASFDGLLRLYRFDGNSLTLLAKRDAPAGRRPFSARFSPDGQRIAVGFYDSPAVNVLAGDDLAFSYAPELAWLGNATFSSVAWSRDGGALYGAGRGGGRRLEQYIRRWAGRGTGSAEDWPVAEHTLMDLAPLPDGRLAFGGADPAWGVVDGAGVRQLFHAPVVADFRSIHSGFTLSADGARVRFAYAFKGKSPAVFDIQSQSFLAEDTPGLIPPLQKAPGFAVTDWYDNKFPKLDGTSVKMKLNELSRSLAMLPGGDGFILGSEWTLRAFDSHGSQRWQQQVPGIVWGVNVSQDGRWVVAAYGDGTIRWHRATDGVEQLAFFPHTDKQRWIMWTPEGYYTASPGGADLIGWHLNQGKDQQARFIPSGQLYDVFFRPDIVLAKFRGDDISGLITLTAAEALKNPPPLLTFTTMPASSTRDKERVCYKVTSTGGGIGEVRLFQNGKLVKSDGFYREVVARKADENMKLASLDGEAIHRSLRTLKVLKKDRAPVGAGGKGNEFEECHELETMPGENEISVAAFNAPNTVQSTLEIARFTVDRKPEEPHLYVLAIGIDTYRDPSVSLQFAVKDAVDFRAMILEKAASLYQPQNIHIEGLSDKEATKEGIQKAIQTLSGKVKLWDSFILFVASHGALLDNQYYIVTAGYDGKVNPADLISSNEIVGMSKNIKSLSQLFIFDTCHAGGVDNIVSGLYDARMSVMAKKMGLHIYASAGSVQEALDGYKGNGLFTHSLLKSMTDGRNTDSNKDDQVSVIELGQRARQETTAISKALGHPQTPYIISFGRDSALFRVQ